MLLSFIHHDTTVLTYLRTLGSPEGVPTFGAPDVENHPLDYDHSGLNKYDSLNGDGYVKSIDYLSHILDR